MVPEPKYQHLEIGNNLTIGNKYNLVSRVKDRSHFNIDDLEHYSLLLQLGADNLQVCVTDARNDTCLLLEDYEIHHHNTFFDTLDCVKQIFDDHHFLLANFWDSVTVSLKTEKYTWVPEAYFSENQLFDYLKFNTVLTPVEEKYCFNLIDEVGAVSVFAVNKILVDYLDSVYINVNYKLVHQSQAVIKSLINSRDLRPYRQIYINYEFNRLHIIVLDDQKLIYYNQFNVRDQQEFVRYILMVAHSLEVDLKQHGIVVWSYTLNQSPYFQELNKFVKNLQFGQGPTFLKRSYDFDDLQEYQYMDVYGIYLCA